MGKLIGGQLTCGGKQQPMSLSSTRGPVSTGLCKPYSADWMKSVRQSTTITEGVLTSCSQRPSVVYLQLTSWVFYFRGSGGTPTHGEPCSSQSEGLGKAYNKIGSWLGNVEALWKQTFTLDWRLCKRGSRPMIGYLNKPHYGESRLERGQSCPW